MAQRLNITLPEDTLQLIDRVAKKGNRSRFIDQAVRHYIDSIGKANLRKQLAEGGRERARRDLEMAGDWFPLEEELWRNQK